MSLAELDRAALRLLRTRGHGHRIERAVASFSRTGEHGAFWFALGLLGAASSTRRREWTRAIGVVAVADGLNFAVKLVVRRPRPELPDLPPLTGTPTRLSFPSAHSTTSFAAARAYGRLIPATPLYLAAVAFALSRTYLGVHYPSDVVAGAALGTAIAGGWPR